MWCIESAAIGNQPSVYCFSRRPERKRSSPDSVLLPRPKHHKHPKDLALFLFYCFGVVFKSPFFCFQKSRKQPVESKSTNKISQTMLFYSFQQSYTSQRAGIRCHTEGSVLLSSALLVFCWVFLKKV